MHVGVSTNNIHKANATIFCDFCHLCPATTKPSAFSGRCNGVVWNLVPLATVELSFTYIFAEATTLVAQWSTAGTMWTLCFCSTCHVLEILSPSRSCISGLPRVRAVFEFLIDTYRGRPRFYSLLFRSFFSFFFLPSCCAEKISNVFMCDARCFCFSFGFCFP